MLKKISKKKKVILLLTLFIYIPLVFAAINYSSSNVAVDTTNTEIKSSYLQTAIDEIDYACSTNHPSNYACKSNTPKCIRATTLHTEVCNNEDTSYYCQDAEFSLNDTITYGNTTTTQGVLTVGDAFDCDVNGDGVYNPNTERFYFLSEYFDTERKKFNDKVAVLIYYSNTTAGVASTSPVAYNCSNISYYGPVTAIQDLPTTQQWSNIRLYKETRQILAYNNSTSIDGHDLPSNFSYAGYASRIVTYQELYHGCYNYQLELQTHHGLIGDCFFLFENSKFVNSSYNVQGSWTETAVTAIGARHYDAAGLCTNNSIAENGSMLGTRPVIEVLKSEISY